MRIIQWQSWYEIMPDEDCYILSVLYNTGEWTISILRTEDYISKVAELERKYIRGIQNV